MPIDIYSHIHLRSYFLNSTAKKQDLGSARKPIGICAFQKGKSATERYC